MKIYPYIFSLLACIGIALPGYTQVDRNETLISSALHGLEYEIKAGFSIGGTAPLPLPVEIRSIDGYNPTLAISIGGEVTKWIAVRLIMCTFCVGTLLECIMRYCYGKSFIEIPLIFRVIDKLGLVDQ